MSNFGCTELRLVNPYEVAFREARSAVKAYHVLEQAREYATLAEAVADCALVVGTTSIGHRALEHPLKRLELGGRLIARKLASAPVALLFGSEKFGLSNADLSHCHWLMRIPTREEHGSMNLGQAVAVCLYELARDAKPISTSEKATLVTAGDLERLTSLLREALQAGGYLKLESRSATKRRSAAPANEKIRRLIRRMSLSVEDAELLLGMLRQILWRLNQARTGSNAE